MADQTTNVNSLINTGLGSDVPDAIKQPEARAIFAQMILTINNLVQYIEQYCGVTQKDISQWSTLPPSDTIKSGNLNRLYCKADVNLSYGHMVNLFDSGVELRARLADSSLPRYAHAFCNVSGGVNAGDYGEFILFSGLVRISGAIRGTAYYLAPSGLITPILPGNKQVVGFGVETDVIAIYMDLGVF